MISNWKHPPLRQIYLGAIDSWYQNENFDIKERFNDVENIEQMRCHSFGGDLVNGISAEIRVWKAKNI